MPGTEETRRSYREMLFATPELGKIISGVILFEETLRQQSATGAPLPQLLAEQGIVPGTKWTRARCRCPAFPVKKR